ncbi:hypothetical protein Ciccas_012575 [Cichlidogyrus casuarinus]|uniref:MULE transposase domain-containing protein n=1 Tax=Cichlidogyrus casuarinus TaxID=1844966 RepID=A0ABD2PT10_9PLAT
MSLDQFKSEIELYRVFAKPTQKASDLRIPGHFKRYLTCQVDACGHKTRFHYDPCGESSIEIILKSPENRNICPFLSKSDVNSKKAVIEERVIGDLRFSIFPKAIEVNKVGELVQIEELIQGFKKNLFLLTRYNWKLQKSRLNFKKYKTCLAYQCADCDVSIRGVFERPALKLTFAGVHDHAAPRWNKKEEVKTLSNKMPDPYSAFNEFMCSRRPDIQDFRDKNVPTMQMFYKAAPRPTVPNMEALVEEAKSIGTILWVSSDHEYAFIRTQLMQEISKCTRSSGLCCMDTTYSFCQSYKCTALIVPMPGGSYPLAFLIHKQERKLAFQLFFELLFASDNAPFGGKKCPALIMTDDSKAEKAAIEQYCADAHHILCQNHVLQNVKSYHVPDGFKREFRSLANVLISGKTGEEVMNALELLEKMPGEGCAKLIRRIKQSAGGILHFARPHQYGACATNSMLALHTL